MSLKQNETWHTRRHKCNTDSGNICKWIGYVQQDNTVEGHPKRNNQTNFTRLRETESERSRIRNIDAQNLDETAMAMNLPIAERKYMDVGAGPRLQVMFKYQQQQQQQQQQQRRCPEVLTRIPAGYAIKSTVSLTFD
jgi:hypothetical protein